ncbi:MAG: phosphoglycerate kinase [Bacteroidales bacterium]|jgi:phosphoglycerate kinase|nr:phosphoglycerate kinase [Bacteroidales bacterium]
MKKIDTYNFKARKAIVRVDFNVPLNSELKVTDNTRIRGALPTIRKIVEDGGSAVLMSHLGRPKSGPEDKFSLRHIIPELEKLTGRKVKFAPDCIGAETLKMKESLEPGDILLLENLRFYEEETKGDESFASELADGCDVYVNDAFGTAHRAHASTTIIARFFPVEKLFGFLIDSELESMDRLMQSPEKPFTAIMGGAKVSDKILIIENLLGRVDNLLIGGGMAYTFIRAQGGKTGNSLCEEDKLDLALDIIKKAKENNVKLLLPADSVNGDKFEETADTMITSSDAIEDGWMGMDIGYEAIKEFAAVIKESKTILWNGPMGVFEMEKFSRGTSEIAKAIAAATQKGAFSLIGGGDSVAAINKNDLADKVSYVSTGGGAMLEYMEGKVLPGIAAIRGD